MRWQHPWWSVLVAAVLMGLVGVRAVAAAGAQFLPVLSYREGAQRFTGIPRANGYLAYLTLLNERDGGINGVPLVWEECETVWDVTRGVECYERLKAKGPTGAAVVHPYSTPLTYALTERVTHDQIPLLTVGFGRADAADGRVFPYLFTPPSTYWSQNSAKIRFIGRQAVQYGFTVQHLAVKPPGLDQKATWLRVKVAQPDWVILRTFGVMTATALKEAAQVGFPRDKMVGASPTCGEQVVMPAGEAAIGFICPVWHGTGSNFPLIQDVLTYVYARGKGAGPEEEVGAPHWIRGLLDALLTTEGIRTAMRHFGHQPLTGAQVQWGLEHLTLTATALKELGAEGLLPPLTLSCRDHEGGGA
jgi:branched-chain amino acid transport system substrate-binding protein